MKLIKPENKHRLNITDKIIIGESDYDREQMFANKEFALGDSLESWKKVINHYEKQGYAIEFKTSIFRTLFCLGKYKVIAVKYEN